MKKTKDALATLGEVAEENAKGEKKKKKNNGKVAKFFKSATDFGKEFKKTITKSKKENDLRDCLNQYYPERIFIKKENKIKINQVYDTKPRTKELKQEERKMIMEYKFKISKDQENLESFKKFEVIDGKFFDKKSERIPLYEIVGLFFISWHNGLSEQFNDEYITTNYVFDYLKKENVIIGNISAETLKFFTRLEKNPKRDGKSIGLIESVEKNSNTKKYKVSKEFSLLTFKQLRLLLSIKNNEFVSFKEALEIKEKLSEYLKSEPEQIEKNSGSKDILMKGEEMSDRTNPFDEEINDNIKNEDILDGEEMEELYLDGSTAEIKEDEISTILSKIKSVEISTEYYENKTIKSKMYKIEFKQ